MSRLATTSLGIARLDGSDQAAVLDVPYPDIGAALAAGVSLPELAAARIRASRPLAELILLPPVPRPSKIWALGLAYRDHIAESGRTQDAEPYFFLKAPSSLIGSGQPIRLPRLAPDCVDYEGEVGVVIGRSARNVTAGDAWASVAGITICNDVSARDVQHGTHMAGARANTTMGKSFDTFTPCGPCVATLDELADRDSIGISTYVDGERRQHARTSEHIWPIPEMIAFLSARTTLCPGDLVSTGTPAGVGAPTKRFLRSGSVVRIEVEGVGTLENPVVGADD